MPLDVHDTKPLVRNASSAAADLIRAAIIDGHLQPRDRLKEEELARELGISRTPVREALLLLQSEGLVVAEPNRGSSVREHSARDLDDLYQLRALLEGFAARRAAVCMTDETLVLLGASSDHFDRIIAGGDLLELVQENARFHDLIVRSARSKRLEDMIRRLTELPLVYRSYSFYTPEQRELSAHYHRQIYKALLARDPERSEILIKEHLFEARDLLTSHVPEVK